MKIRPSARQWCALVLLLAGLYAFAQQPGVPALFRYSARLANWDGSQQPVLVTARLYSNANGGWPLWLESYTLTPDSTGKVTMLIGGTTGGLPPAIFADNAPRWVSLQVADGQESPRELLISVPYALKARDADTLGGLPPAAYLKSVLPSMNNSGTIAGGDNLYRITTTGTSTYIGSVPSAVNLVPKFVNATDLAGSQIIDTGLAVGIGNTTPQEMLDIQGRAIVRSAATGPAGLWFGNNDSNSPFLGLRGQDSSSTLSVFHGGLPRINVTYAGRVGIGVDQPAAALDVNGGIKLTSGTLTFADGTSMSTAAVGNGGGAISLLAGDSSIVLGRTQSDTTIAVADAGITSAKLADASVSTSKLADGSITASKLAPGVLSGFGLIGSGANTFSGQQTVNVNGATTSAIHATNKTTGNPGYAVYAEGSAPGGSAVMAYNLALSGAGNGLYARSDSPSGIATYSQATSTTGTAIGVYGITRAPLGIGVKGEATMQSGTSYGVDGETSGGNYSAGVYAHAADTTANTIHYGLYGRAEGIKGVGVFGYAPNTAIGVAFPVGIGGQVDSASGVAGHFTNTASSGNILLAKNSTSTVWRVDNTGNQYMLGTVHTGGADFAELVDSAPATSPYEPGDVLVISTSADRQVERASEPYSTRVLGVFATKPGILASQRVTTESANTGLPLAMIGIVPAKASAENGPIERGDLLVSSGTPGHLMKATDRSRMTGAIVGKAMQPLASGTGVIEIAVTLQ